MEAIPPLPWAADVQGGTLKLSKAVSLRDLIDGVLKIKVTSNHGETDGKIKEYPSDHKIYIDDGNGNFMYEIERFEGYSKRIRLTKTESTTSTEALISVEFPAVIAPLGDIQLFKDPFGYEYADGTLSTVYARVNNPWASPFTIGNGSVWQNSMLATAPTTQSPNDKYSIAIWVDFTSEEFSNIQAGQIIPCSTNAAIDVTNAQKIFNAKDPLPVEGDVQIFADDRCLKIPAGELDILYARVNKPWGFNGDWVAGRQSEGIICYAPDDNDPDGPYSIDVYTDYRAYDQQSQPFTIGQVVRCESQDAYDVTGLPYTFSKPE